MRLLVLCLIAFALISTACDKYEGKAPISYPPMAQPIRSARLLVSEDALWASHPASQTISMISLPDGNRIWQTPLGCEPATLARSESKIYAACYDSGNIAVLDEKTGKVLRRRWVGHGPF